MANVSKLSLAALRDRIAAGTREVDVVHNSKADGTGTTVVSKMIYVPKFRVPAGLWDGGAFPAQDLLLGGFLIDKYQCSQPDATNSSRGSTSANSPGQVAAVSQQGVVPWTDINWDNAKVACANRKINGRSCHLVTMKEWATICFIVKLLGHDIRGNNYWGRDLRDPDSWEYYGIADPVVARYTQQQGKSYSRLLTGTGPVSWSHNGMANGIVDIVGNVWEWIDFLIDCGRYQDYCVIPGGWTAKIADTGLNNTTNPATFTISDLVNGPGGSGPAVGDVLQCQTEQMTITAVNGSSITVSRGANGSTITAHTQGTGIAKISPQMSNDNPTSTDANYGASQFGKFVTMRTEAELAALALPASVSSSGNEEWKDGFWLRNHGQRAALRGGSWDYGSNARAGFVLTLTDPPSNTDINIGFRAALSL